MLRKVFYAAVLFVFLISPATVTAKNTGLGKWWHRPQASEKLNLSKEEINKLDKQFVDSRRKLIKLESALKSEQFELDNLLENEHLDEKATVKQFARLQQARTDLANEQFRFLLEIRKILGLDRFRQLKQYKQLRRQKIRKELGSRRDRPKKRSGFD